MRGMTPIEVAHAFRDAINRRNPGELAAWMTEDHVLVDSLGNRVSGKEKMVPAWTGYFRMVPDYSITVEETFSAGDTVVMLGTAQGTWSPDGELRPENRWNTPAAAHDAREMKVQQVEGQSSGDAPRVPSALRSVPGCVRSRISSSIMAMNLGWVPAVAARTI